MGGQNTAKDVLLALAGGALVLAGVVVTQFVYFLTAYNDRKERRRQLVREKFEECCESIADSIEQVQDMLRLTHSSLVLSHPPSAPLWAHYLSLIYFPELQEVTRDYSNSVVDLHRFVLQHGGTERDSIPAGILARENPNYSVVQKAMQEKRSALDAAIEKHAAKYTMA